ncbi:hypothetical protein D3C73_1311800 [compost metagenome]
MGQPHENSRLRKRVGEIHYPAPVQEALLLKQRDTSHQRIIEQVNSPSRPVLQQVREIHEEAKAILPV